MDIIQESLFGGTNRGPRKATAKVPRGKKQCTKCLAIKPLSAFGRKSGSKDGRSFRCKTCLAEHSKGYRYQRKAASWERNYGLSEEAYWAMFEQQGGVCAICGKPETRIRRGTPMHLSVDHDHATGQIRGLLCEQCNRALGCLYDDPRLFGQAIAYLLKNR